MAMEIIHEEFRQNHRRLWISSEDCDVLNVNKVENLIERCLQLYMNKDEVVKTLLNRVRIDPGFTTLGTNAARASTSKSGSKMMISREAFESLSQKVEESERLAGMKVEAAMAQIEAVGASEKEALKCIKKVFGVIGRARADSTSTTTKKAKLFIPPSTKMTTTHRPEVERQRCSTKSALDLRQITVQTHHLQYLTSLEEKNVEEIEMGSGSVMVTYVDDTRIVD
nr:hypothetical protein [Tanacetum cinerariifolium]